MTGTEASDGQTSGRRSAGRHGSANGTGGLSAAELIARSRAASPDVPPRPSRRARRAEQPPLTLAEPAGEPAAEPAGGSAAEPAGEPTAEPAGKAAAQPTSIAAAQPTSRPVASTGRRSASDPAAQLAGERAAAETLPVPPPVRHLTVVAAPTEEPPDAAEVSPPRVPKAGRNHPAAIAVGLALGALIWAPAA